MPETDGHMQAMAPSDEVRQEIAREQKAMARAVENYRGQLLAYHEAKEEHDALRLATAKARERQQLAFEQSQRALGEVFALARGPIPEAHF